jgi:hypothetical protein
MTLRSALAEGGTPFTDMYEWNSLYFADFVLKPRNAGRVRMPRDRFTAAVERLVRRELTHEEQTRALTVMAGVARAQSVRGPRKVHVSAPVLMAARYLCLDGR